MQIRQRISTVNGLHRQVHRSCSRKVEVEKSRRTSPLEKRKARKYDKMCPAPLLEETDEEFTIQCLMVLRSLRPTQTSFRKNTKCS